MKIKLTDARVFPALFEKARTVGNLSAPTYIGWLMFASNHEKAELYRRGGPGEFLVMFDRIEILREWIRTLQHIIFWQEREYDLWLTEAGKVEMKKRQCPKSIEKGNIFNS